MTERLPLFPLGSVLFPGLVLPLHVFEERYRALARELLELPEPRRRFGVVLIREGREVDADGVHALYDVGTVARVEQVEPHEDGRFDLVTVGAERFRLHGLDTDSRPFLVGEVEELPDAPGGDDAGLLVRVVAEEFRRYLAAVADSGAGQVRVPELPTEPLALSFLVAAAVLADPADRQALLAAEDVTARLRQEVRLLRRETVLLDRLGAAPVPELLRVPFSPN